MSDLAVYRYKTATMKRLQLLAVQGYFWYTAGQVNASKALKLVEKFETLYHINANENQRSYRRHKGKANAKLLMYPKPESQDLLWWLLVTDGTGDAHKKERLLRVTDQHSRLQWNDDYELVLVSKEGTPKLVMTWRMTKKNIASWHKRLRIAARSSSEEKARQALWSLNRTPGFSEVRLQNKQLRNQFEKEWFRAKKKTQELPDFPKFVPYVRSPDLITFALSLVVRRMKMGIAPFPRSDAIYETRNKKIPKEKEVLDDKSLETC